MTLLRKRFKTVSLLILFFYLKSIPIGDCYRAFTFEHLVLNGSSSSRVAITVNTGYTEFPVQFFA